MRLTLLLLLLLGSASAKVQAEPSERSQADAAYAAKQYGRCAQIWSARAAREASQPMSKTSSEKSSGKPGDEDSDKSSESFYSAACCQALDGKRDAAFSALDSAVEHGFRDRHQLEIDTDLGSLRSDARWSRLLAALDAKVAAWEKTIGDPALRREILAMVEVDQAARNALIATNFKDDKAAEKMAAIDRKNTARMKEIVAAKGWPTRALVGGDGAGGAWLLVQHADLDVPFQKLCLAKMEPLTRSGDVAPKNYAYLVDRVAVAEKRKQTYGTQFNDKREPQPIEDEAHVDERRKAVGLGTMAEYKQQMLRVYGPPK